MDIDEFIQRMENNYECTDEFKNRVRATLEKIKDMDVSHSTKVSLMQKAEETYLRHSQNCSNLSNILSSINRNNEELAKNLDNRAESETNSNMQSGFNIDLD